MRVAILTNGPGELWGWARPVVAELKRRGHRVSLWLLPCPFASGHEAAAARLLGAGEVFGPAGAVKLYRAMSDERADSVLQLGGDMLFGVHVARASNAPLFCYTYGPKKGLKGARVYTAFQSQAELINAAGGPSQSAEVIGDIVKDALIMDGERAAGVWGDEPGAALRRVLFLPGSRPAIRNMALPWLAEVKSILAAGLPGVQVRTLFPPFAPKEETGAWEDAGLSPTLAGAGAVMMGATIALTQPGTNTLELMHCGLPALAVAPESFLDVVPIAGLKGIIASCPLIGRYIRRKAALRVIARWGGFISLPNRIAGRAVMDEMFGDVTPRSAAELIMERLADAARMERISGELLSLSGPAGAAGRLCDAVTEGAR